MPASHASRDAISASLERVLASPEFGRSERARDLLRYLVSMERAGRGGELKGYTIAVDVFGKAEDFDPASDPVVRVQAGRLRELLAAYYAGSGNADDLRIVVPRGSYVPIYEGAPSAAAERVQRPTGQGASLSRGPSRVRRIARLVREVRIVTAAVAVMSLVLVYVVYATSVEATPDATHVGLGDLHGLGNVAIPDGARLRPEIAIERKGEGREVEAATAMLVRGLAGFDTVDLISPSGTRDRDAAAADFALTVGRGARDGTVALELRQVEGGRVIFADEIAYPGAVPLEDLVAEFLTKTMTDRGALYAYILESGEQWPLARCLSAARGYFLDQTSANHRRAYSCFENLLAAGVVASVIYSELATLHLEAVTDGHPYPKGADTATALQLARRAVALGPMSPYAHRATGFLLTNLGAPDEANRWMRRASELNPFDLSMAASYGYALMRSGDYAESTRVMQRAISLAATRPTWWDYTLFLGAFMQGEMDSAASAAAPLATTPNSDYLAARLIAARHGGDTRRASDLIAEISRAFPAFALNPRAHFEDNRYPTALTDRLVDALQAAGLGGEG